MYDPKTIRRRRAVLALLVISSVVLLTASFGGSGGVGAVQRGVFEIVSPIQDVASRSLKPFRDLFGWFGDTWHAKGENDDLRQERDSLRQESVRLQADLRNLRSASGTAQVVEAASLKDLAPVDARVIAATPTLLFQKVTINKGHGDGIRSGQAVVTTGGLVGKIDEVVGGSATITLLTDSTFGAQARIASTGTPGTIKESGGNREDLVMETTDPKALVAEGAVVVTKGTADNARLRSLFPPDIPIGKVTRIDDVGTDTQRVHLRPFVDVRDLDHVLVLTRDPMSIP